MSTVGDVIVYNLGLDVGPALDPLTIYNANTTVFSASSQVPSWLYQPLYTLLGCASSDLHKYLVPDLGTASVPTSPCIVVQPTELIESAEAGKGLRSDTVGARTCEIDLMIKNVITNKNITLVDSVTNRVIYLLDKYSRESRTVNPDYVDLIVPNSISGFYSSPFRCYHISTYLPVAKEGWIRFRVEYNLTMV